MTQILKPTDAMIEAGRKALTRFGYPYPPKVAIRAAYTAMESARDPNELREALFNFAIAAGKLVTATDGMEELRPQRQAVVDALKAAEPALSRNVGDVG